MSLQVAEISELKHCFDGSFMKEAWLTEAVSQDFIFYLGQAGELQYYPSFARPFYKVAVKGKGLIKGVEGNRSLRLILNRKELVASEEYFVDLINHYHKE